MRITGAVVLAVSLGTAALLAGSPGYAKGKAKAKAKKAAAASGDEGHAPSASAAEVNKLKAVHLGDPKAGTFKWGMKPEEVMAEVRVAIENKYQPRIEQASQDPGKQQRVRDEMAREINAVKKSYTKFEGQKSGWDVSIVGPEFQQGTAESVLVTKEDQWTRYYFFFEDGLYKMFLAFNKDALQGKSFQDFGKSLESKYGKGKQVYRDEKTKGGVDHILDHYLWSAGGSDRLKLVDRSEFYGVYCLVLFDGSVQERVNERRKVVNPGGVETDPLVEAIANRGGKESADENDDIIDRVTGKETKKPGTESHDDIVVPSTGNAASSAGGNSRSGSSGSSASTSESKKKGKKSGGSDSTTDGLEL
ncbi:MAG TPA: hypothetical protein VFG23_12795 [Polyangia bacterium]|nr:hypothetical protein [Polyangia bacterium]